MGSFDEYLVPGFGSGATEQVVSQLLFYENAEGTEQYMALYRVKYARLADESGVANQVFIDEVVRVEVDKSVLGLELGQAQQKAIREDRQRWG